MDGEGKRKGAVEGRRRGEKVGRKERGGKGEEERGGDYHPRWRYDNLAALVIRVSTIKMAIHGPVNSAHKWMVVGMLEVIRSRQKFKAVETSAARGSFDDVESTTRTGAK